MSERELHISKDLALPLDAVTQKFAILGRTGSGKSYCATKLCEEMLDAGAQVIALDPVGVWYGLRVPPEARKTALFDIPIFGGLHGDVPLEPGGGELIANLIVDRGISAVLDVSQFLSGDQARFAYDFATRFFFRKKSAPSAVHLFVEECQEFVPQNISGGSRGGFETRMLNAFERLIKLGRNFGIGASLISQRPQEVNKKALNQAECMLAFQMTGPQERKAVAAWVADKAGSQDVIDRLPKLQVGECQVWSPQWLQVDAQIKIAKKRTADVSSTPKAGEGKAAEPKPLSQGELEKFSAQMLETLERAKAEDPRELRKQIAELKRERNEKLRIQGLQPQVEIKRVEVPVLKDGQIARLEKLLSRTDEALLKAEAIGEKLLREGWQPVLAALSKVRDGGSPSPARESRALPRPQISRPAHGDLKPRPAQPNRTHGPSADGEFRISAKQQQILDAIAFFESIGNARPSTLQVGAIALIDATGGYFSNTVGPLASAGLVVRGQGVIELTEAGRAVAQVPERIATLAEYHGVLRERVRRAKSANGKTVALLDAIIARGGAEVSTEELGRECAVDHTGGYFSNSIGPLSTIGLITRGQGIVRPTGVLFPEGIA